MKEFSTLPPLKRVIESHGLLARKSLGQHFLLDTRITDDIARYAGDLTHTNVIEIGPGPGGLTRSLLAAGAKTVHVVEKDDRCIAIMQELQQVAGGRLHIIHGDALEVDLLAAVPAPRKIVANLPYNAGTAMLLQWLEEIYSSPCRGEVRRGAESGNAGATHALTLALPLWGRESAYQSLTLMFQKEVAERIAAAPGGKHYGRLSVISQWLCDCRYEFELPPQAFTPPPKVASAVVTLTPRPQPLVAVDKPALERIAAAAFGQRRKMLRQALKSLGVNTEILLTAAGIDGTLRAEKLSVEELGELAIVYNRMTNS